MRLKFYTDTHIDRQVAVQLRNRGVDVVRCEEVGLADADDEVHLVYAAQNGRVLVTKDDDFIGMHMVWQQMGQAHAGILFCPYRDRPVIGLIVKECLFYAEAVESGGATIEADIANQLFYIT